MVLPAIVTLCVISLSGSANAAGVHLRASLEREYAPWLAVDEQANHATKSDHVEQPGAHYQIPEPRNIVKAPVSGTASGTWLRPLRVLCIFLTVLLQLSPLRPVLEIRNKGDALQYDGFPFFIMLAGSLQWCMYGAAATVMSHNWNLFTLVESNGPGVVFGLFYVTMYCHCVRAGDARRGAMIRYIFIGGSILLLECLWLAASRRNAIPWIGFLATVLGLLLSIAPLKTLPEVLRTKSTAGWPTDLIVMCFIQSAVMVAFAWCIHDLWIMLPNIFGTIAAGLQLLVILAMQQSRK